MNQIAVVSILAVTLVVGLAAVHFLAKVTVSDLILYGGFLILVLFVIVITLMVLGPNVGEPFSTINYSLRGV